MTTSNTDGRADRIPVIPSSWRTGGMGDHFAYSYGIRSGNVLWIAGMVSRDVPSGDLVGVGDIERQTEQVLDNMSAVLAEVDAGLDDVMQLTTYVTARELIAGVDAVRRRRFTSPFPTNTVAIVAGLGNPDYLVELQAVAAIPRATR